MDVLDTLGWTEEQLLDLRATGYSYLLQGLYQRAIVFFEALTVLAPTSAYDVQTLGAIYLQKGQAEKAVEWLDRALDLDPTHEPTLLNKSRAFLISGKLKEGLALARTLLRSQNAQIRSRAEALLLAYE